MKSRIFFMIGLAICLLAASCGGRSQIGLDAVCRESVGAIEALPGRAEPVPKHFSEEDILPQPGDFDPNTYFDALTHLSLEEGYVLDYLYYHTSLVGFPLLYARPDDHPPYQSLAELEAGEGYELNMIAGGPKAYMAHIQVDDTPEGYLQFAILRLTGDLFYLGWHANNRNAAILCSTSELDLALESAGDSVFSVWWANTRRQAGLLLGEPAVRLTAGEAQVQVITYFEPEGIYRQTVTISRQFPHQIARRVKTVAWWWPTITY